MKIKPVINLDKEYGGYDVTMGIEFLFTIETDLKEDLLPGSEYALENLAAQSNGEGVRDPGIVIGSQLASSRNVRFRLGRQSCTSPVSGSTRTMRVASLAPA